MGKKPNGVAVDVGLHAKVKSVAAARGSNLERAYDEALRLWLGEEAPVYRGKYAALHGLLDAILLHAPPHISAHVKQVLEIHSEHLGKGKAG